MTNKEAIEILTEERRINAEIFSLQFYEALDLAIEALELVNDSQDLVKDLVNERPKGKWIHREDMDYLDENKVNHIHFMCEKCEFVHDFIDGHTAQYNFCPNCGAKMREAEE